MRLREGGQIRRNIGAYVVGHELLYGRGSFFRSLERFAMETSLVPWPSMVGLLMGLD